MPINYEKMTDEEFDDILREITKHECPTGNDWISIPGVYDAVRKHFRVRVIDRWAKYNPKKAFKHTVKCPRCNVLIGVVNDDNIIKCTDCGENIGIVSGKDGKKGMLVKKPKIKH